MIRASSLVVHRCFCSTVVYVTDTTTLHRWYGPVCRRWLGKGEHSAFLGCSRVVLDFQSLYFKHVTQAYHREEPVRFDSFRFRTFFNNPSVRFGSVRFGSESYLFRFDAVRPALFGCVLARSGSVRMRWLRRPAESSSRTMHT